MQITDRVKNCNGCEACTVGCKYACIKMERVTSEPLSSTGATFLQHCDRPDRLQNCPHSGSQIRAEYLG